MVLKPYVLFYIRLYTRTERGYSLFVHNERGAAVAVIRSCSSFFQDDFTG